MRDIFFSKKTQSFTLPKISTYHVFLRIGDIKGKTRDKEWDFNVDSDRDAIFRKKQET